MAEIILASQSPRRKQLLEWAEVDFEIMIAATDETYPPGLPPQDIAIHIAREKADAVHKKAGGKVIIAADTIVVLENEIIGKPKDRTDALSILQRLNGALHEVITGVVIRKGQQEVCFFDRTEVRFHKLHVKELEFYVDKYHPYDKAGAYAIQEWIGVVGIHSVRGDFYNVMGLPVSRVVRALREINA